MLLRLRHNAPYLLMVLPALIIFCVFFVAPVIMTFQMSLTDFSNFSAESKFIGVENYAQALEDPAIQKGIVNSLWYAFAVVILNNVIALPVAVILNSRMRGRTAFRAIFFSPAVLSILVVGFLWSYMLSSSEYGLVNGLLGMVGVEPVNFFGDPDKAMWSIIVTQVWQWFGYAMVIYLANLQSIPAELYEAASIDGATRMRQFWHVTLPNLLPALQINFITGLISGLKVFDIVFSTTKGGPGYATETVLTLMFAKFSQGRFGYAAAFGIVFLIVTLVISTVMLRIFKRMETRLS
ncbi:carbohydrate ABC transporter permease [Microbacterium sp. USHLN186]|uniref:carbohydrate ABC transporter permease n=1 Tax=Microbacterium sp. USHLN186 TaxID=3081286 RepID=UPI00301ACFB6